MRNPILEIQVSDLLMKFAEEYPEAKENMPNGDLQGWCEVKAYDIIKLIEELQDEKV